MNVLVDVNHPAHVHLFKHLVWELQSKGHEVTITSRNKEVTVGLLDRYGFDHTTLSTVRDSLPGLAGELLQRELGLLKVARRTNPDVYIGCNPAIAHTSSLLGGTALIMHDSEPTKLRELLFVPFADRVVTPEGFTKDLGAVQLRYPGYHELAYLHPNRFDPDPEAIAEFGIDPDERFFLIRFIAWNAYHDRGQSGFSRDIKRELVSRLSKHGTVYITSEAPLPAEFEQYRLPVPPHLVHDVLHYADLYVGDSQTMATEAAVLGTPAIRSNSFADATNMSNFEELEHRYGLLYSLSDEGRAVELAECLAMDSDIADEWNRKRRRLLDEKIDVTDFLVELITAMANDGSSSGAKSQPTRPN